MNLIIVTHERHIEIDHVIRIDFQTPQGGMGVLPGHAAVITSVECGVLSATTADGELVLFVTGTGFARIDGDRVLLLLPHAISEDEVDAEAARTTIREKASLPDQSVSAVDPELAADHRAELDFAVAQLDLIGMRRRAG
jgi:F-type H+-transporting ATPase subunit epsilon